MGGRSRRRKADWVYRPDLRASDDLLDGDTWGSYEHTVKAQTSGVTNARSHILYDSVNRLASLTLGAGNGNAFVPRAARAEGRKPTILAVEGIVYVEPSTWAIGNLIAMGLRIGIFDQDPIDGAMIVEPDYTLWIAGLPTAGNTAAIWANQGRRNLWERRVHHGFSDNQTFIVVRVRWRGRRRLEPHEALVLYTELEPTSVNVRTQSWLRTLVIDEG